MSDGLNQVTLLGNIGQEPEYRVSQGGVEVLAFSLATSRTRLTEGGEKKEETEWHNAVIFGKRAGALSKILRKGARLCVAGSIHYSTYEKDGEKRYKTEIRLDNVVLCEKAPQGASVGTTQHRTTHVPPAAVSRAPIQTTFDSLPETGEGDDEIPF